MTSLVFGILVFIFVEKHVNGIEIQFFRNRNFTGLNYESNSTAKCNNIPADKKNVEIYSIKTDTCLMVYQSPNCERFSKKIDRNNNRGWGMYVRSFQICNEDIGGPQLKIDITKYYDSSESGVLESYRDVCTCINVPQYVQRMSDWSINNYGNEFLAYYEPDCSEDKWYSEHVPAGFWCPGSECMDEYEKIDSATKTEFKIKSIGPNPNSTYFKTSCSQIPINNQTMDSVHAKNDSYLVSSNDLLNLKQIHDQDISSLYNKIGQLENRIDTLLTEDQVMKEKTVELEIKLETQSRSYEDSIKKLKDDFEIFA